MSFGFPANHECCIEIPAALDGAAIIAALRAVGIFVFVAPDGQSLQGSTSLSFWSWGEKIVIRRPAATSLHIRSECAIFTQCIDWGRNADNTFKIARAIQAMVAAAPPALPSAPAAT